MVVDTLAKDSGLGGVALVDSLNISTFSTLKKEAFHMMSKTMIVIYCYVNNVSDSGRGQLGEGLYFMLL